MLCLTIHEISKSFGKIKALQNVSIELDNGSVALLGPNGAGKTTLLRILATLLIPDKGSISIGSIAWSSRSKVRPIIGYLPQHFNFYPYLTVYEALEYISMLKKVPIANRKYVIHSLLEELNLEIVYNRQIHTLSGGTKRRLGIAQALMNNPRLLLIDEPTAGLDPEERIRFRQLMAKTAKDRLVVISSHLAQDVEWTCNHVAIMDKGRILSFDTMDNTKQKAKNRIIEEEISQDEYDQIEDAQRIISSSPTHNKKMLVRYVSNTITKSSGSCIVPTLEDAYMAIINGGRDGFDI